MKKIFSMMIALVTMFTVANAQTVEGSSPAEEKKAEKKAEPAAEEKAE